MENDTLWCPWRVEVARPQQVTEAGLFAVRDVLEAVSHVYANSDGCFKLLVLPESHPWSRFQRSNYIAEERWQAHLGELRRLEAHSLVKNFGRTVCELVSDLARADKNLVCKIPESIEDDQEAALISLDQSKIGCTIDS